MAQTSGLMAGKRGLIMGVANNRSIAWGIAKACADAGAELAFTWQGDALKKRVEPLAQELGAFMAGHCDVTDLETLDTVFSNLEAHWGKIEAPTLIKSALWTATAADNTVNILSGSIVEEVNTFVSKRCDEVKDQWAAKQ